MSKALNQQPENPNQNQTFSAVWKLTFFLVAMVIVGVIARLEFAGVPNVKPVAAMALWATFCFRSFWLPAFALLIVMASTDLVLGGYSWPIMISVYVSMLFACILGSMVRRQLDKSHRSASLQSTGPRMLIASLAMSTCFYLLTNAMVWACGWYPPTLSGLVESYVAGLPFYRFTLLGDLMFTTGGLVVWQIYNRLVVAELSDTQIGVQA